MYRQIIIHPQDQDVQRILLRSSPKKPIQEFNLTTVTYGTASAPFLATRCLKKLADDNQELHQQAAQVLHNDFYVDDLLSGTSTLEEAIQVQKEVSTLLQTAGFTLRKWASNHPAFLDTIPEGNRKTQHLLSLDNEDGVATLGLLWNPNTGQLQVKGSSTHTTTSNHPAVTKHNVLSIVASIFDPIGLVSPIIFTYKLFLQTLWEDKLQWDELHPNHNRNGINYLNKFLKLHILR